MQSTVACDWVHCSLRLVSCATGLATGILCDWYLATGTLRLVSCDCCSLLIADVTADFIIADPALALLFTTADCDDITADVIIADHSFLHSLLIADVTADFIIADPALALLFTTADCDDITADVIIADHSFLQ
ncbi:conserved oligomeric Golgi complex subunit 1-like [Dorcoceras hygrometricum]|uniref:Conserved oligomeric Golgi complex subunit 1-like n=1 Tax=Dorcoceras hygrometricum TaxID=472368 RepID=A0A2Z7BTT2_9LAMI|nr:conserved oligomeric Golgi complex subunit 1-like [Dorcoceras hygrometricum]